MKHSTTWHDKLIRVCTEQRFDDNCIRLLLYIIGNLMLNQDQKLSLRREDIVRSLSIPEENYQLTVKILTENNIIQSESIEKDKDSIWLQSEQL